jgi:hypothetical protein
MTLAVETCGESVSSQSEPLFQIVQQGPDLLLADAFAPLGRLATDCDPNWMQLTNSTQCLSRHRRSVL